MRTVAENKVEKKEEVKQEFNLKEVFVLWKNKTKDGVKYLSGYTSVEKDSDKESVSLRGKYNSFKENPKQPDIRVYSIVNGEEDTEVAALWETTNEETGKKYLTGRTNDKEKLIGFYTKNKINDRPDIRVYYKD